MEERRNSSVVIAGYIRPNLPTPIANHAPIHEVIVREEQEGVRRELLDNNVPLRRTYANDQGDTPPVLTLYTSRRLVDSIYAWRKANFGTTVNAGEASDTSDPDADGIVNLLEYAFGSNPTLCGSANRPEIGISGSRLEISFPRVRSDLRYGVFVSGDLEAWTEIPYVEGSLGQIQRVVDPELISNHPQRFLRVDITNP